MAQPYVGEIRMFAGDFAPSGWMFCSGQTLPIADNETLFQLIGTTYGGDGKETFNLPDMQSRVPMHMGTGSSGSTRVLGEMAGTEQETLTSQQIPAHTHPLVASGSPATATDPSGNALAATGPGDFVYSQTFSPVALGAQAVVPVGGSQPHENVQPFTGVNFIISLFGVFPSQT